MEENRQIMRALATAMNRIDQMYCDDVTRIGVKASELWLLYALDDGAPHSQKQICQEWGLPKTTLNTTLKQAEAKGYLTLVPIAGKRRERQICLTAAGQAYARQVLRPIYGAEDAALQATLDRYGPAVVAALVEAVDYFGRCLRDSFAKQMEEKENDDNPGLRRGHPNGVLPVRPALRPDRAGHAQRPVRQVPDLLRQ